ncbi:hypothetical protein ACH492_34430 [Streptomyces sp. NPDC019443]|uniref:hypothetical protein n=1 Tax=Streptomyces sp. NPDC019443 TaxID=3365061 RepID=UPI003796B90D
MPSPRPTSPPAAVIAGSTALLVTALALVGCSGSVVSSDNSAEPAVTATPTMLDTAGLRLPLESYQPTAEQREKLQRAQDNLIDQCMRRYGFRYPGRPAEFLGGGTGNARRYGVSSPSQAAKYGYANSVRAAPERPPMDDMGPNEKLVLHGRDDQDAAKWPNSQEEAEKSDEGTTVADGRKVPAGGCVRESALKLFTPTKDTVDYMFIQNLTFDAYGRSQQDSRVVKAMRSWSDCMADHGYRTDEPVGPMNDLGFKESEHSSPEAITAAKQDVACKKEVNLVGIWSAVETSYQNRLIDQNAETLKKADEQLDDRLRLADSLIR